MKIVRIIILILLLIITSLLLAVQIKGCQQAQAAASNNDGNQDFDNQFRALEVYTAGINGSSTAESGLNRTEIYGNEGDAQYNFYFNFIDSDGVTYIDPKGEVNIYCRVMGDSAIKVTNQYEDTIIRTLGFYKVDAVYDDNGPGYITQNSCLNILQTDMHNGFQTTGILAGIMSYNDLEAVCYSSIKNTTQFNLSNDEIQKNKCYFYDFTAYAEGKYFKMVGIDDLATLIGERYPSDINMFEIYLEAQQEKEYGLGREGLRFASDISISTAWPNEFYKVDRIESALTPPITNTPRSSYFGHLFGYGANKPYYEYTCFNPYFTLNTFDSLAGWDVSPQLINIFIDVNNYQNFLTQYFDTTIIFINDLPLIPGAVYAGGYVNSTSNLPSGVTQYFGNTKMLNALVSINGETDRPSSAKYNYDLGFRDGRAIGFDEGLSTGQDVVNENTNNYQVGYRTGLDYGFAQGIKQAEAAPSSPLGFLTTLMQIFNIEILPGFTLSSILTIVVGFAVLTLIIKLVKGS